MKEYPVIFNAEMVRAILDGRKTQTRRVIANVGSDNCIQLQKPTKTKNGIYTHVMDAPGHGLCPFGAVGERLWVRENFFEHGHWEGGGYDPEDSYFVSDKQVLYPADGVNRPTQRSREDFWRSRPSIHMPRWASRITLEITGVRVERLCSISGQDAIAEGLERYNDDGIVYYGPYGRGDCRPEIVFGDLWKSIYGEEGWGENPWVWVIEFRRVA